METEQNQVESKYVGYAEAARYLGLSEATVRRYVWLRELTCFKPMGPHGRTLFSLDELDDFMASRRVEARAEA